MKNNDLLKLSDEQLLLEYNKSDKKSYVRELFKRYLPLIYGVCLNYLKDADYAEDVVKQIFDNLQYKLTDSKIVSFRDWIYNFTKDYCLQAEGKENDVVPADAEEQTTKRNKVLDLLESNDDNQADLLADRLKELSQKQRVSINYFFKDKIPYAEIADKTGYTLKQVKSYIENGKRELENYLEETNNG